MDLPGPSDPRHSVKDGYLEVRLPAHEAVEVILAIQRRIRSLVPVLDDPMSTRGMEGLSRLARMGYEVAAYGTMSSLDYEDVVLLRGLRLERCAYLGLAVNATAQGSLRSSGEVALSGDRYAKDVSAVLNS